jgi:ABC-2 type transport system permease protein
MFLSIGVFSSALTRSQIVAGIVAFVIILVYTLMDLLGWWIGGAASNFLKHLSPFTHLHSLSEGHVDTRDLIYFVTMTALWLFMATRVLESRKWR